MNVKQDISDMDEEDWKLENSENFGYRTGNVDTTPDTDKATRNPDGNKAGWLVMIQMSVFMLVLIYICGKIWVRCRERWEFHWPYRCLRCCYRSNDARDSNDDDAEAKNDVLCYLCNKKVPFEEWNNSETGHRRYCAVRSKDNRDLLADMPHANVPCRICRKGLRIWPLSVGPPFFYCRESTCKFEGKEIINNSANRFNCYACDFDLCRNCGISQIRKVGQQKRILLKEAKPQSAETVIVTTHSQRPKRGLVGSPGECKFFIHQDRKDKSAVSKVRLLSQLSDPLRRKVYEPKIVVEECKKDENIAATSDKISQLSLSFRKDIVLTTKDGDSIGGIDNEEITLCTLESSQKGIVKSYTVEDSTNLQGINSAETQLDEVPILRVRALSEIESSDILSPNGTEDTIIED